MTQTQSSETHAFDPAGGAAAVIAGGLEMTFNAVDGAAASAGHVKTLVIAVPNTIVQTAAAESNIVAGATNQGLDVALDRFRTQMQQAKTELQAAVREFAGGLPKIG